MLLIPNALCWSSRKCNCACALPAEVQLRLRITRRSWQKLYAGKNFVKILVTVQTQLRSYSEQQSAFGNSNICNYSANHRELQQFTFTPRPIQPIYASLLSFLVIQNFWSNMKVLIKNLFKGALDNFSLIPRFFFKKVESFIPLEVYTYVVTACLILLASST